MPKYLFKITYDSSGAQAIIDKGGTARVQMATQLSESLGGSLEAMYFAFGSDDAIAIAELPDNEAAAAVALTVGAGSVGLDDGAPDCPGDRRSCQADAELLTARDLTLGR